MDDNIPQSNIRITAYCHRTNGETLSEDDASGPYGLPYADLEAFQ